MSPESTINTMLSGSSGLDALVSERIYPDALPAGTPYPAIVFLRAKTDHIRSISGRSFGATYVFHIDAWGTSRTQTDSVGDQIETIFNEADASVVQDRSASYDPETDLFSTQIEVTLYD